MSINHHPDVVHLATKWAPRPPSKLPAIDRRDYHAGYSDGFYGYHFGAGHAEANESEPYRHGYADGRSDVLGEAK